MELEKEIHQVRFKNDYHKLVVNMIYSYSWITGLVKERLSTEQVTLQQYNVLRILRGQFPKPATINLVKERMLDKMSDASRIVERLVQKELVTRTVNAEDRRAVDIVITQVGLDVLAYLDPIVTPEDILKKNITEEEAHQLNVLLDKLRG
ncbi:Transcriptional regulator, MarR family [Arcticibacter svalbardensis MN12-7]|uniref:Transcriptional regulator, MarR family n=1 Tax=Arcticibacter svalbardensis MN12-7 TaxID=1150600 RepID=R9GNG2_9SPHI|nr:MarR family transcriptional regulator [Arcticibacter svalbardensis]EOR93253.1 Transcriptional regulator, MarR family [Arcticibacter svalbardensis MN12-7]